LKALKEAYNVDIVRYAKRMINEKLSEDKETYAG
jgi:hypothetical protein